MRVSFLYFEDCPSHEQALERLRAVMEQEDVEAGIEVIEVVSEEQARELRFLGSPSIRINGEDIEPVESDRYALTCRAYRREDGRVSPLPPEAAIRRALRSAASATDA